MVFELFCYAVAIIGVLAFVGGDRKPATVEAPKCELVPDVQIDGDELAAEMARISDEVRNAWISEAIANEFEISDVEPAEAIEWQPTAIDTVVPFVRPVRKTDWASMSAHQLRKECSDRGIKWRNVHGKGKHLSKALMVKALQIVEAATA